MTGQQHMWQPSGDLIITDDIADHTATLLEVRGNQLVVRVQGHEGTINLPDDLRLCACVPGPSVVGSGVPLEVRNTIHVALLKCRESYAPIGEAANPSDQAIDRALAWIDAQPSSQAQDGNLEAYRDALEGLTPGGSEFAGDPQRCAAWVRERMQAMMAAIAQQHRASDQGAAEPLESTEEQVSKRGLSMKDAQ